jgi:hypothetical protein
MPEKLCPQCGETLVKYRDGTDIYWDCPDCGDEAEAKPRHRKMEVTKTTISVNAPAPSFGYGIASAALGILSLLFFYIPIVGAVAAVFGVLAGVTGLILGGLNQKAPAGFSFLGVILGGLGLLPTLLISLGLSGAATNKDPDTKLVADVQPDTQLVSPEVYGAAPPNKHPDKPVAASVQPDSQAGEKEKQTFVPPISQPGEKEKQTFTPAGIPRSDKTNERPPTRNPGEPKLADRKEQKVEKRKGDSQAKEKQRHA